MTNILYAILATQFIFTAFVVLTGCTALFKHKEEIKPILHDVVDEEVDNLAQEKSL